MKKKKWPVTDAAGGGPENAEQKDVGLKGLHSRTLNPKNCSRDLSQQTANKQTNKQQQKTYKKTKQNKVK